VHEGDFGAKVRIRDLAGRPHLFALGPLEGLLGEITVLDGRAVITTVEQGKVHATAGLDHGAAFLAWTYAGAWTSVEMPDSVRSMAQVENYLPAAIRSAGIGLEDPIAFRIEGAVDTLNYHILNRPADSPPTMEAHEKSKVHFALAAGPVHLVGFHSQHHRGEFTPGTSDIHVHFVSADTSLAGHVESFVLASGARLLLAIPSR
jgi:acetolactate decarboxylase